MVPIEERVRILLGLLFGAVRATSAYDGFGLERSCIFTIWLNWFVISSICCFMLRVVSSALIALSSILITLSSILIALSPILLTLSSIFIALSSAFLACSSIVARVD